MPLNIVNFNDTTPAAPSGSLNVHWQNDGSGNMSANWAPAASQTWTPTWSGSGGMTVSVTLYWAFFIRVGSLLFFSLRADATCGGTLSNEITATAPVPGAGSLNASLVMGNGQTCECDPSTGNLVIALSTGSNFPAGVTPLFFSGCYALN